MSVEFIRLKDRLSLSPVSMFAVAAILLSACGGGGGGGGDGSNTATNTVDVPQNEVKDPKPKPEPQPEPQPEPEPEPQPAPQPEPASLFNVTNPYQRVDATNVTQVRVDDLWSFGDSYSDVDRENFPVWSENLDSNGTVASLKSFARSGARARGDAGLNTFTDQVNKFFNDGGSFGSGDLTSIYLGYNDLLGGGSLVTSKAAYRAQTQRLINAGAIAGNRRIFVAKVHDISQAPDPKSATEARVADWNAFIENFANGNNRIVAVDLETVFDRVVANPARFGFTNVTTPSRSPGALYVDPVHFGRHGQEVIAEVYRHYLTRGWDWANTVASGSAAASRLNRDIDNGLLLSLSEETDGQIGIRAFTFGDMKTPEQNDFELDSGASGGHRADLQALFGFDEQEGGAGLRFDAGKSRSFGFALGSYGESFSRSEGDGGNRGFVQTDGVSVFMQQEFGGLEFDSRLAYGRNEHYRRERADIVSDVSSASFDGETVLASQRIRMPFRASLPGTNGWLTPWVRLDHESQSTDGFTMSNPYLSNLTYEGDNVTDITSVIGLDVASDPLQLNRDTSLHLQVGLAYLHPIRRDDYRVTVSEEALPGSRQDEIIERESNDEMQLRLAGSLLVGDAWRFNLDYALTSQIGGRDDHGLTAALHYRF